MQIHKFLSSEPTNWNPELTMTDSLLYFQLIRLSDFQSKIFPPQITSIYSVIWKKVDKFHAAYVRSRRALKASVGSTSGGESLINKIYSERLLLHTSQYLSSICLIGLFAASLLSQFWSGHSPSATSAAERRQICISRLVMFRRWTVEMA